jgi:chemotaxis response regulator CheB
MGGPSSTVDGELSVIGIGASTGGPPSIRELLAALRGPAMPPVVIVQHLHPAFVAGFVAWLARGLELDVELARDGAPLRPRSVLVAPPDQHLEVDASLHARLTEDPPRRGRRPAVDALFESLAREHGAGAAGVLLTGMGEDGARGLWALRCAGALTLAQDEASSLVSAMPRAAVALGAAALLAPPAQLGRLLAQPAPQLASLRRALTEPARSRR